MAREKRKPEGGGVWCSILLARSDDALVPDPSAGVRAMRRALRLGFASMLVACGSSNVPTKEPAPAHAHHAHGPLVHRFEHAERWAPIFDDPARDAWQRPNEVVDLMTIAPGMTVADVGAGTGYFEPWLSRAVGDAGAVLALDVEPDMVRYITERAAREKLANVRASVVSTDDPKLSPASVDRVLVVDTWHHVPGREAYAKKLAAGLKPGGKIVIVDFTLEARQGPPMHHRLSPDAVVRELSGVGLAVEIVKTSLPDQYVVVGAKR